MALIKLRMGFRGGSRTWIVDALRASGARIESAFMRASYCVRRSRQYQARVPARHAPLQGTDIGASFSDEKRGVHSYDPFVLEIVSMPHASTIPLTHVTPVD